MEWLEAEGESVDDAVQAALDELGELVEVTRTQPNCTPITKQVRIRIQSCRLFRLSQPKIIAVATDSYLMSISPANSRSDPDLPGRRRQDTFQIHCNLLDIAHYDKRASRSAAIWWDFVLSACEFYHTPFCCLQ